MPGERREARHPDPALDSSFRWNDDPAALVIPDKAKGRDLESRGSDCSDYFTTSPSRFPCSRQLASML